MKTNSNNSKASETVAMSTKVFNLFGDAYLFIWWVILCNPLSMLVINLFKPKFAAKLAHQRLFCGEQMCSFYTKLALKWGFKWAKWWLTPDLLKNYTPEQQLKYFLVVNQNQNTLNALSEKACLLMVKHHSDKLENVANDKTLRLPDTLFNQTLNEQRIYLVERYVKRGTLPKEQTLAFMQAAIIESRFQITGCTMKLFIEYVERCGLSKELFEKFKKEPAGAGFMHCAIRAQNCYEQRCVVNRYHNLDTENAEAEWARYLREEGKLYVNPSMVMSLEQYKIFHKVGLTLKPDAILKFLEQKDFPMCEAIFRSEPNHGLVNEEIRKLIDDTPVLKQELEKILTEK